MGFYSFLIGGLLLLVRPGLSAIPPALTACAGPCRITEFALPVQLWHNYVKTTLENKEQLASLSLSLAASLAAASSDPDHAVPFEINTDVQPSSLLTAPGEFTTIECCDELKATLFLLNAGGTSCGVPQTNVPSFPRLASSTWNAFYATIVPEDQEYKQTIGGNQCETETADVRDFQLAGGAAFAPLTKTYVPVFVLATRTTSSGDIPQDLSTTTETPAPPRLETVKVQTLSAGSPSAPAPSATTPIGTTGHSSLPTNVEGPYQWLPGTASLPGEAGERSAPMVPITAAAGVANAVVPSSPTENRGRRLISGRILTVIVTCIAGAQFTLV